MQFGARSRMWARFIVRWLEDQGTIQQPGPSPVEGACPERRRGASSDPIFKRPKGRDPGGSIRMRRPHKAGAQKDGDHALSCVAPSARS